MRTEENNLPLIVVGLILTLGILAAFQVYVMNEPVRIDRVLAADQADAVANGQKLFKANCVVCHGQNGEGLVGPALSSKTLLASATDATLFSIISSGVPNTAMPAWNQSNGGPFTDEQVRSLVAFIRNWEKNPPPQVSTAAPQTADATHGAAIFKDKCAACHGPNGEGLVGPKLHDPALLAQFDDAWFRDTITNGRPSKGMPTWGTVLSPQDINDVIAFLRTWAKP